MLNLVLRWDPIKDCQLKTAFPRYHRQYWIPLEQNKEELIIHPFTVPPVSRHWSCQSGESNLRAWISGDVQAGIRLRPVNSMHLARKKGGLRCAVKLQFREFIKTVPNILKKLLKGSQLHKKSQFGPFGMFLTSFLRLFLTSISVRSYLDTCWVQNFKIILLYKNSNFSLKDFKKKCLCDHHHVLSMTHFQAAPSMKICRCLEAQLRTSSPGFQQ